MDEIAIDRAEVAEPEHTFTVVRFDDVYGFAGNQGIVNLEGIRYVPRNTPSKTLLVYMHPSSTLQLLPMPRAMAPSRSSRASSKSAPLAVPFARSSARAFFASSSWECWRWRRSCC